MENVVACFREFVYKKNVIVNCTIYTSPVAVEQRTREVWVGLRKERVPQATRPKPVSSFFSLLLLSHLFCSVFTTACLTRPKHASSFCSTATIVPFVLFCSAVLTKCLEQAKSVVVGRNTVSTMKMNFLEKKIL